MRKIILLLTTIAVLAPCIPVATHAATQVYDLKTDWSDTQNPNGTWSYRFFDGSLMPNDAFPWGYLYWGDLYGLSYSEADALARTTAASAVPEFREVGDIFARTLSSGVKVRWTAPANGTINASGALWNAGDFTYVEWALTLNGNSLSGRISYNVPRSAPDDLSLGSAGPNALLNIPVRAGDQVELSLFDLHFGDLSAIGINFSVCFAPDSVDPVTAIEDLALTVIAMNLQNGIANSLDSKLDAAINALIDANFNNDGAACNSLAAFISAVEAQRGKKITNAQADQLITSAQQIRGLLNCGN